MLIIFLTPVLIRHLWQLKTVVFLHRCLICAVLLTSSSDVWPTYFLTKWHSIPNSKLQLSTSFSSLNCLLSTVSLKDDFFYLFQTCLDDLDSGEGSDHSDYQSGKQVCQSAVCWRHQRVYFNQNYLHFFGNRFLRNLTSKISLDWTAAVVELLMHSTDK
jgi:hypothetical protein